MSACFFAAGALIAAAIMLQIQDRTLPWWALVVPAMLLLLLSTAPNMSH